MSGKKVFVEDKYFESYDKGNAISLLRERLSISGALLVKTDDKAEIIVEIRSPVLSMDNSSILIGLPAMTVPVPLTGPLQTPELAFFKESKSDSLAKFGLFAYERESGHYLESSDPMLGRSHLHVYKVLFISWKRTDVPEAQKTEGTVGTTSPHRGCRPSSPEIVRLVTMFVTITLDGMLPACFYDPTITARLKLSARGVDQATTIECEIAKFVRTAAEFYRLPGICPGDKTLALEIFGIIPAAPFHAGDGRFLPFVDLVFGGFSI